MAEVETIYRQEFRARVLGGRPRSILEVGSGAGTFLKSVQGEARRLVGLDPLDEHVFDLQAQGFEAVTGNAETLPFQDHEFDVVVFSFTPHHVSDWRASLLEAVRVARHSVEILDVWYDETIPDQRIAHALDRWCKEIDRRTGMIHHDTLLPGQLLAPLAGQHRLTYDYVCRRVSAMREIEEIRGTGRDYLARAGHDAALALGFDQIIKDAQVHGLSEEGCVQMTIELGQ